MSKTRGAINYNIYAIDIETTTKQIPSVAYLSGLVNIFNVKTYVNFTDPVLFVKSLLDLPDGSLVYAHNLKFEWSYIHPLILNNFADVIIGFKYIIIPMSRKIIEVEITVLDKIIKFRDSLAIFACSLAEVAQNWCVKNSIKGKVTFYENVPEVISLSFYKYHRRDVLILAEALERYIVLRGGTEPELTASGAAYYEVRKHVEKTFGKGSFLRFHPMVDMSTDKDLRLYYRGGLTYVNPDYKEKVITKPVNVVDVNSMYPYVMKSKTLPWGKPIRFYGKPVQRDEYPLYVVTLTVKWCDLKEGKMPFITNGLKTAFGSTEYVSCIDEFEPAGVRTLRLTNVEHDMFLENYNNGGITYKGGFYFKGANDLFEGFINEHNEKKMNSKGALRSHAKLTMNGAYGKFGQNPEMDDYITTIENGIQKYVKADNVDVARKPKYLPVAIFVTAYARMMLVEHINKVGMDDFVYCDTDSLHFIGNHINCFDIHDKELGAWKHENTYTRSKYLRTKRYCGEWYEEGEKVVKVVCTGLGAERAKGRINSVDEFDLGVSLTVKRAVQVEGGIQIIDRIFTI